MYTVAKAPIKIVTKTRRGINQNIENLRDTKKNHEENGDLSSSDPKPYFQPTNGKKSHSLRTQQEAISPQHEELIKYIYESWNSVCQESEEENAEEKNGSSKVVYYHIAEPSSELKDFTPFDLESWWGKRLFNTITKSIP
uniref:Protein FAM195A n=1 Tax=Lygus hesperus TaxID=30085 RepID=A0A0A9YRV3_LYGHE